MMLKLFRLQLWLLPTFLGLSFLILLMSGVEILSGGGFEAFGVILLMIPLVLVVGLTSLPVYLFEKNKFIASWILYTLFNLFLLLLVVYYRQALLYNIEQTLPGNFVWFVGVLGLILIPLSGLGLINSLILFRKLSTAQKSIANK